MDSSSIPCSSSSTSSTSPPIPTPAQTLAEALFALPLIPTPMDGHDFLHMPFLTTSTPTEESEDVEDEEDKLDFQKTMEEFLKSQNHHSVDVTTDAEGKTLQDRLNEFMRSLATSSGDDSGEVTTPKRRLNYTLEFKNRVIQYAELTNNCQAATKYNVPRQCIQRWRQIKPELEKTQMNGTPYSLKKKRLGGGGRPLKNVELDEKLDIWLQEKNQLGIKVTGKMIKDYAMEINGNESFKASNGWLQRFMIRHGLATPPAPKESSSSSGRSSPSPPPTSSMDFLSPTFSITEFLATADLKGMDPDLVTSIRGVMESKEWYEQVEILRRNNAKMKEEEDVDDEDGDQTTSRRTRRRPQRTLAADAMEKMVKTFATAPMADAEVRNMKMLVEKFAKEVQQKRDELRREAMAKRMKREEVVEEEEEDEEMDEEEEEDEEN